MTATLDDPKHATGVTSGSILNFDVIKERAAEMLEIGKEDVTDIVLAALFELTRETIWRFRSGAMKPSLPTALAMAEVLDRSVEDITVKPVQAAKPASPKPPSPKPPSPPRPAAPSTPKPPQGPKVGD